MNTKSMIIIVGSLCFGAFVCGGATAFVLNAQNESAIPTPTFSPTPFSFQNNLKIGDNSQDVRQLQILLNDDASTRISDSGIGSKGQESTYFGALTQSAVMRFQAKYKKDVLDPYNVDQPTGFVGAGTRKKLNELASNVASTTSSSAVSTSTTSKFSGPLPFTKRNLPVLYTVRPQQIRPGETFTLVGAGFEIKNTIHIGNEAFKDVFPQDNNNISFTIPSNSGLGDGTYEVWVENVNGKSSAYGHEVELTITNNPQPVPTITKVSPEIVSINDTVTITGTNFSYGGNTIISGFGNLENVRSNGSEITFSLKDLISKDILKKLPAGQIIKVDFYVLGENGVSNVFGSVKLKI